MIKFLAAVLVLSTLSGSCFSQTVTRSPELAEPELCACVSGLCVFLTSKQGKYLFELVDSQSEEIESVRAWSVKTMQGIIQQDDISRKEKENKIIEVRDIEISKIKDVLLPNQVALIELIPMFEMIRSDGLVSCLVSGGLGYTLDLEKSERDAVSKEIEDIKKKYLEDVKKSQEKAIERIQESLSASHAKKFRRIVDSLRSSEGLYWSINLRELENGKSRSFIYIPE